MACCLSTTDLNAFQKFQQSVANLEVMQSWLFDDIGDNVDHFGYAKIERSTENGLDVLVVDIHGRRIHVAENLIG